MSSYRKIRVTFEVLLFVFILISHLYSVFSPPNSVVNWFTTDDAYYYYKVAQNISEGYGSTFDRIGLTNGYHPLWMIVCIPIFALARYDLILPLRIVILVLALLNAGSGILLFRLAKRYLSQWASVFVALFWTMYPGIHGVTTGLGMESGLNTFFTALLLYRFSILLDPRATENKTDRNVLLIGIVATLALLSRLDNLFLVGVLGAWLLFRTWRLRILLLGDLAVSVVSVMGAFLMRLGLPGYYYYASSAILMMVILAGLRFGIGYLAGVYRQDWKPDRKGIFRYSMVTIGTSAAVSVIILILLQFHALERFPRLALPGEAVIAMCAGLIWRILVGRLLSNTTRPFQPWSPTQLKTWLMTGVRYFAPVGIVLSVYMGINWFLFGTPSPVSGQIKRWWGTLMTVYGKPETSLAGLFGFSPNADLSPWTLFTRIPYQVAELSGNLVQMNEESQLWVVGLSTFVLLFLVFLLLRLDKDLSKRTIDGWNLVPLLVGGFLQMFNYKVSGYVSLHAWYWIAQMMLLVLLYGLMLDSVFVRIRKSVKPSILVNALALFCATALVLANLSWLNQLTPWKVPKGQEEGYLWGARGLEENTPEGSLIGSTGGGVLGYFTHGRTIVNMDGLISSFDYFKKLKAGIAAEHLDSIGLDYVYAGEWVLIYSEPYTDMFEGRLRYIDKVVGTDLYEYLPGK